MLDSFSESITIYNRFYDADAGRDVFYRTVVDGVSWQGSQETVPDGHGRRAENRYRIRIPATAVCGKSFVPPVWVEDLETEYTLREGDRIVKGVAEHMPATGEGLAVLDRLYPEVCTVTGWRDNRRRLLDGLGCGPLPHLAVEGE